MSKRNHWGIIIGLFIIVVIVVIGGYYYYTHTRTTIEQVRQDNGTSGDVAPFSDLPPLTPAPAPTDTSNPLEGSVPKLRKISATPVAGADIFNRKVSTSSTEAIIRYVDKGTGNIYETSTSSLVTTRITFTTIPKISSAVFASGGNSLIIQYLDQSDVIQTYFAKVTGTSSEITGSFINPNAIPLTFSPLKTRFFFMGQAVGGAVGFISDLSLKTSQIFTYPLRQWQAIWPNETAVVLTTKPSSVTGGVAYQLSTKGGNLVKLMGPKNGLVVLPSPKIDTILYSETINDTLLTGFHDVKNNLDRRFAGATIPDKCIWAPSGNNVYCGTPKFVQSAEYPDVWYQGVVSFNDYISVINPFSTQQTNLIDLQAVSGEQIDAVDLHLSSDENYLIFTNKKDLSLWGLRLN